MDYSNAEERTATIREDLTKKAYKDVKENFNIDPESISTDAWNAFQEKLDLICAEEESYMAKCEEIKDRTNKELEALGVESAQRASKIYKSGVVKLALYSTISKLKELDID